MPTKRLTADQRHARLIAKVALLAAAGNLIVSISEGHHALTTPWDAWGVPLLAAIYAICAGVAWFKPAWLRAAAWCALVPASVFMQGSLCITLQHPDQRGLYNIAAVMQFMPLLYVGAYTTLRGRSALWLCWGHYAVLMLQFGISWLLSRDLPFDPSHTQVMIQQALITTAVSHPLYILALPYIVRLRRSLDQARQDSYRSKARFLAMVSHELRTPLQSMLGSVDLLGMRLSAPADQRVLTRLRVATHQLQTHLKDITEYTQLEDPALSLQDIPVDLVTLCQDLLDDQRASIGDKPLALRLDLPDPERPLLQHAHGDPMRVRQVLLNLLVNAVKYTNQGEVLLRVRSSTTEPGMVCFTVEDTGMGIALRHHEAIFQPYVRLDEAKAHSAEGTGLGLAVVKRLVDRMEGHLTVNSTPGVGSRFDVILPMLHNA